MHLVDDQEGNFYNNNKIFIVFFLYLVTFLLVRLMYYKLYNTLVEYDSCIFLDSALTPYILTLLSAGETKYVSHHLMAKFFKKSSSNINFKNC